MMLHLSGSFSETEIPWRQKWSHLLLSGQETADTRYTVEWMNTTFWLNRKQHINAQNTVHTAQDTVHTAPDTQFTFPRTNRSHCSGHSSHCPRHTVHTAWAIQFTPLRTQFIELKTHSSHYRQENFCNSFLPDRYRSSLAPPDRVRWYLEGAEVWAAVGAGVWFLSFCPVESVSKKGSLEDGYSMATVGS